MSDQQLTITIRGQSQEAVRAIKETAAAMGQLVGASVEVDRGLAKATDSAGARLTALAKRSADVEQGFRQLGTGVALAAAPMAAAVKVAADFDQALRGVDSIAKLTPASFVKMRQEVLALTKDPSITQGPTDLANGLYQVYSSGQSGSEALETLKISAIGATAGMTDTTTSAKALLAVMNSGIGGVKSQREAMDVLFKTVDLGVLNFQELASSIGAVLPAAKNAGISLQEVGAAVAVMTRSGQSAGEATNDLLNLITKLIRPPEEAKKEFDALGISYGAAALQGKGLAGVLQEIAVKTNGDADALARLFPDLQASRGAISLLSEDGRKLTEMLGDMGQATDGVGAAMSANERVIKGAGAQFEKLKQQMEAAAIEAGTKLLPNLIEFTKWAGNHAELVGMVVQVTALAAAFNQLAQALNTLGAAKAWQTMTEGGGIAAVAGKFIGGRLVPAVGIAMGVEAILQLGGFDKDSAAAQEKQKAEQAALAKMGINKDRLAAPRGSFPTMGAVGNLFLPSNFGPATAAEQRALDEIYMSGREGKPEDLLTIFGRDWTGGAVKLPGGGSPIVRPFVGPPKPVPGSRPWEGLHLGSQLEELRKQPWYKEVDAMWRKQGVSTFAWEQNVLRESGGIADRKQLGGGPGRGIYQFDFKVGVGRAMMDDGLSRQEALAIANDPVRATEEFIKREQRALGKVRGVEDPIAQMLAFAKYVERPKGSDFANPPRSTPFGQLLAQVGGRVGQPLPPQYGGMALESEDPKIRARMAEDLALQRKLAMAEALPGRTAQERTGRELAIHRTRQEMDILAVRRHYADQEIQDAEGLQKHIKAIEQKGHAERIQILKQYEDQQAGVRKGELTKALNELEVYLDRQDRVLAGFGESDDAIARKRAESKAAKLGELTRTLGPKLPASLREELQHQAFEAGQRVKGFEEQDKLARMRQEQASFEAQAKAAADNAQSLLDSITALKKVEDLKREIAEEEHRNAMAAAGAAGNYEEQIRLLDQQIAQRQKDKAALGQSLKDQLEAKKIEGEIGKLTRERAAALDAINQKLADSVQKYADAQTKAAESTFTGWMKSIETMGKLNAEAKELQAQFEKQQAEKAGPAAYAEYLQKQLQAAQEDIAKFSSSAPGSPGQVNLWKAMLRRDDLMSELEKLQPGWKAFWQDLAADAASELKNIGTDALAGTIESLLGGKDKLSDVFENLLDDLRGLLAQSISRSVVEWISDGVGGLFGGGKSSSSTPPGVVSANGQVPAIVQPPAPTARREPPADFVGPPEPPGVVAPAPGKGKDRGAVAIAAAGIQTASAIMGLVDVFKGARKDLAQVILQLVSSIISIMSAWPGGGAFRIFGFADGGEPPVGIPSMVGERGPELFVPRVAGTIVPNHRLNIGMPRMQGVSAETDARRLAGGLGSGRLEGMLEELIGLAKSGKLGGQTINQNIGQVRSADDLTHSIKELGWLMGQTMRTAPTR